TIVINAAGSENTETMHLLIDGVVVQTWNNIGGDPGPRIFEAHVYNSGQTVTIDQIRVELSNAQRIPPDIDSNLRVDNVVLDGVVYETEDTSVFSTGTWVPGQGFVPGFHESEWLNTDGYFQFAASGSGGGSQIVVNAAGSEGDETMQLLIDGNVVSTWFNVGGDASNPTYNSFLYTANDTVTIDQIRVQFTNALWVPPDIDRNLRVDNVVLDGVVYETEDPSVYSTGTWMPADGIVPGFRQSEFLHANGYFEYADPGGNNNAGTISVDITDIDVNELDGTAAVTIIRQQGATGEVTVDYRTIADTAIAGEDYTDTSGTAIFADGVTEQTILIPLIDNGIDEPTETLTFTIDNVQGGAALLAPRTALITIMDDDYILPIFADFNGASGLSLNGSATISGDRLRLTAAAGDEAGSGWYVDPLPINVDTSFQTSFAFQISGGDGSAGADGLAFVIQNSTEGASALGIAGQGLGFGGVGNSLAIEFDTWDNSGDPNDNHISLVLDGDTANAIETRSPSFNLNDGNPVYVWVDYNGLREELSVYLSQTSTKPTEILLFANVDLFSIVGNQAFLGFSAGTGGATNIHEILNWDINLDVPPQVNPPGPGDELESVEVATGFIAPVAVNWSDNGQNMYVAEKSGRIEVVRNGVKLVTPFVDISAQVNDVRDRGLLDIEVHPDFENNPYVYLLFTYDPPEVFDPENVNDDLAGPDQEGNRAGRLIRVTADINTDYTTAVPGSEVILLGTNSTWDNFNGHANSTFDFSEPPAGILPDGSNLQDFINSDSESHTVGGLAFGIDGNLFVSIGDGASYNQVDPRAVRVQDIDNLSGKILRIDPMTGVGLDDNPFWNGDADANRSKVWQYGLRNPFRIAVDQVTGDLFIGDVGWGTWEEVNTGPAGANFGWPYYEGASGTNNQAPGYSALPEAQAYYASGETATPSIFALNHSTDGISAIVLGDVYHGTQYPAEYQGDVFLNGLVTGHVRNLTLDGGGNVTASQTFVTDANLVVQIRLGPDGHLYYVDLGDQLVGRWQFV
ncbi:MAG: PQQ-dependent sugar dehydrogenase, partial [Pirellulaceae bacterium]